MIQATPVATESSAATKHTSTSVGATPVVMTLTVIADAIETPNIEFEAPADACVKLASTVLNISVTLVTGADVIKTTDIGSEHWITVYPVG